jgi:hypothetical protein
MPVSRFFKTFCALTFTALMAACGGGGSDVVVNIPPANGNPPPSGGTGNPPPATGGETPWVVPAYDYWLSADVAQATGTTTLASDRSFIVSNLSLKFSAPYTSGCMINGGTCAERLSAALVMVCPQNQPNVALVDSRVEKVTDLTSLNGKTFRALAYCDANSGITAAVSDTGDVTVNDGQPYLLGPLAALVADGKFFARRVNTPSGAKLVLVERDPSFGWVAIYAQE